MFDGMMPDMPEDNQVSKSAEQGADAVSGDALSHLRQMCRWFGKYPEFKPSPDRMDEVCADVRKAVEFVSSQTASAASPVAGVSGEKLDMFAAYVVNNDGEPGDCLECYRKEHVDALLEKLAQPSAEGDGWIADGVSLIAAERKRQVESEGWTPAHDDEHTKGELSLAACGYTSLAAHQCHPDHYSDDPLQPPIRPRNWPWDGNWWKPSSDPIRNLVKAGALIAAEIDRLKRLPTPPSVQEEKGSSE